MHQIAYTFPNDFLEVTTPDPQQYRLLQGKEGRHRRWLAEAMPVLSKTITSQKESAQ